MMQYTKIIIRGVTTRRREEQEKYSKNQKRIAEFHVVNHVNSYDSVKADFNFITRI